VGKAKQTEWRNRITGHGDEPLDAILFNPANWRVHPKAQQDALEGVLSQVGWVQDVIVNKTTGRLVDGHLRCQVAARNGEKTIPVVYVELDENEEALILATIDPIAAMAATDKTKLDELMRKIQSDDERVQTMLSEMAEKEGLEYGKQEPAEDPGAQVDKAEELREKWQVEPGQLWQLGEHRLICGDCTDKAVVERLMRGEKADMVFTDPPYNVAGNSRNFAADKSKAMQDLKDADWDQDFDISKLFPVLEMAIAKDCAVYICTSQWLVQMIWEWMWSWSDFCSYNVWCKPNPMPSLSKRHWTWATELIAYAVRGKHVSNFPTEGHALNWWDIPKNKDTDHPTEKALAVPEKAIEFSSRAGQIVLDTFVGSGTTLIACERLGRKCRASDKEPKWVATTLERWSILTGQTPELIG
jgi:DNA modification methylase